MDQSWGSLLRRDHFCGHTTVTYLLISSVGENIPYQHNISSGISVFLGNTSHFIPIQWHSKLSVLDTEQQIHFNILPPYQWTTRYSGQSKVIRLKYIPWLRSQNFQSFKQFNTYLDKRYSRFGTSTSEKLKYITQQSPCQRRVKL